MKRRKRNRRKRNQKENSVRQSPFVKNVDFEKKFPKSVILLKDNMVLRLNETGKIIWEFIEKIHPDDMIKIISETKGLPPEKVRKDVWNFINYLEKKGVLKREEQ